MTWELHHIFFKPEEVFFNSEEMFNMKNLLEAF
jgi:hypothetical protein